MKVRKALKDSGDEQAVLVLTLGIDDHDSHLVYRAGHYGEGAFSVVCEAIETLEVIRAQLNVMQATPGARFVERIAYDRGREAASRRHEVARRRLARTTEPPRQRYCRGGSVPPHPSAPATRTRAPRAIGLGPQQRPVSFERGRCCGLGWGVPP